jgi:hypothetical protein
MDDSGIENAEKRGREVLQNKTSSERRIFDEGEYEKKFVHISSERLARWANENGVELSDFDRDSGVLLIGGSQSAHVHILWFGLTCRRWDEMSGESQSEARAEMIKFGVLNAGSLVNVGGGLISIAGTSGELENEGGRGLLGLKSELGGGRETRRLNEMTGDLLSKVYKKEVESGQMEFDVVE